MKRKYIKTVVLTLIVSNMLSFVSYAVEPEKNVSTNDVKVEDVTKPNEVLNNNGTETKEDVLEVVNIDSDFFKKFNKLTKLNYEDMVKVEFAENISGTSEKPIITDVNKELDKVIILLNKAIKNNDKELLKQTIKETFYIHQILSRENSKAHTEKDQFDYLILNSISLIFKLGENNENLQNELLTYIADEMYVSSSNKFNANGAGNTSFLNRYGSYLVKASDLYVKNEKVKKIILYSYSVINSMYFLTSTGSMPGQTETVFNPEDVPSKVDFDKIPIIPPPEDDTDYGDNVDILEPIKPPVTNPDNGEYVPKPDIDFDFDVSFSETIVENGICYKVTTYKDANGKVIKVTKEKNEEECVILDDDDINEENKVFIDEHNQNNAVSLELEVWTSLQTNDLNKLNDNTIQFTINKDSENPYYFDTRINASSNDTVTFTQLMDTFEQIKAKATVYILQDKDKLLFVAEGKTELVIDKKSEYTTDEVSSLLNNFNKLGLKIDEKKSLEETPIDKNEIKLLSFGDKDYTLENSPTTKDNILQLPIEEVATILGYSVQNLDDKIVLNYNKDDKEIVIEMLKNSNKVSINGTNKITTTETQNIDNVFYGEMSIVARELGYTLNFDSELGKINVK